MWSKPWKMKEGSVICVCLSVIGIILQLCAGPLDWGLFAWPVNLIALFFFLAFSLLVFLLRKRVYLFEFMGSLKAAMPSMLFVCGITLIMGLTRQNSSADAPAGFLGFSKMLSSWPFILLYLWMALIVCQAVLKEGTNWKWSRWPAFAFHLGLLLILLSGTLGRADGDPWLSGVYFGIYLMLAGALGMIFLRKSDPKRESE